MEEETEEKKDIMQRVKEKSEELMEEIEKKDINTIGTTDLDTLYKLVDIHKDISNEEYWERKENDNMNYGNYGNYGRGSYGNYGYSGRGPSRGAYGEGYGNYGEGYGEYGRGGYGRRGRDMKYRGDEHLDRMGEGYGRYEEGREQYNRGNYGAKDDTLKGLEFMLQSAEDFFKMLKQEASSPEEMQMFQEYVQRIAQM